MSFILCVALGVTAHAQTAGSSGQTTVATGDPQALQTVALGLGAAGGAQALQQVNDFTGQGTITYYWGNKQVTGTVTVRGRGDRQFILLAKMENGQEIMWLVNGGSGKFQGVDGKISSTSPNAARSLGALTLPSLRLARLYQQGATFTTAGTELVAQKPASKVAVTLQRADGDYAAYHYFDPSSGQLVKIAERAALRRSVPFTPRPPVPQSTSSSSSSTSVRAPAMPRDTSPTYLREFTYSNYRTVGTLQMPFAISESLNGQMLWTMQLTSVQLNVGLSDSDLSF